MAAVPYAFGYSSTTAVERQPIYAADAWLSISGLPLQASPGGGYYYDYYTAATESTPVSGSTTRFSCPELTTMIPGNFGDGSVAEGTSYQPTLTDSLGKQIPYDKTVWVADSDLRVVQFVTNPVDLGYSPPFALSYYKYIGATAADGGGGGGGLTNPLTTDLDANGHVIYNVAGGSNGGLANYVISNGRAFNVVSNELTELFSVGSDATVRVGATAGATRLEIGSTFATANESILNILDNTGTNTMTAQRQIYTSTIDGRQIYIDNSDQPTILLRDAKDAGSATTATYGAKVIDLVNKENSMRTTQNFGGLQLVYNVEPSKKVYIGNGNAATGFPPGMIVDDINVQTTVAADQIVVAEVNVGTNTTITPFAIISNQFIGDLAGVAASASNVGVGSVNDSATYYPVFTPNSGLQQPLYADPVTNTLSYVPSTSTLTATNFSGLASAASSVTILDTPSGGSYYPVFVNGNGTGVTLRADVLTTPFTYNPGTGTLTTSIFSGALSGNAMTATTTVNISGGAGGSIPYQASANTTSLLANGVSGLVLTSQGGTAAPVWGGVNIAGGAGGSIPYQSAANTTALLANGVSGLVLTSQGGTAAPVWGGINIAGGAGGSIPYQSAANTTALLANGTAGQVLTSQGGTAAPTWGATPGLPLVMTVSGTITGASTATTYTLGGIFNNAFRNYKIILSFTESPSPAATNVQLNGFLGSGTLPATGSVFGSETVSGTLSAVYSINQTLSSAPLVLSASGSINNQVEFDVFNVGFTAAQANTVRIVCNSIYNYSTIQGNRNVVATTTALATATITGLSLGSTMGVGNNPTYTAKVYGFR